MPCAFKVIYMELKLKALREDNDYTKEQIAEYLLCDKTLYEQFETGERAIPLEFVVKLADLYNVSVDDIIDFE